MHHHLPTPPPSIPITRHYIIAHVHDARPIHTVPDIFYSVFYLYFETGSWHQNYFWTYTSSVYSAAVQYIFILMQLLVWPLLVLDYPKSNSHLYTYREKISSPYPGKFQLIELFINTVVAKLLDWSSDFHAKIAKSSHTTCTHKIENSIF